MKPKSTFLYQFIHQLNPSEKRYFDLFSERHAIHGKNNYQQLFETIVRQRIQHDDQLNYHLKKTPLSIAKVHLFDNILNSLHQFHASTSQYERIKKLAHQAEILSNKNFYKKAKVIIEKAKKLAIQFEYFELYLELHQKEAVVIGKNSYHDYTFEDLEARQKKFQETLNLIANLGSYQLLFSKIYKLHFQKVRTNEIETNKKLISWWQDSLLENINNAKSDSAKILFHQLKALEYFVVGKAELASKSNQQILHLLDSKNKLKWRYASKYLSILNNYLIDCLQLKKEEEFLEGLEKLKKLPKENTFKNLKEGNLQIFRLSTQLELNYLLSKGDFEKIILLGPPIDKKLKRYKLKLGAHNLIVFNYLLQYAHFASRNFEKSNDYADEIQRLKKEKVAESIMVSSSLVRLLAHYELENEILLSSLIINFRKAQRKRKLLFVLEATLLSALSALIKTPKKERKALFENLNQQLSSLQSVSKASNLMNNFNYQAWVQSKLNGNEFSYEYKKVLKDK